MNKYLNAYEIGRRHALEDSLHKESSAKDVAHLLEMAGRGAAKGVEGLGSIIKGTATKAKELDRGAKYLGTIKDPRAALTLGTVLALGGMGVPAMKAGLGASGGTTEALLAALKAAGPGAAATAGAGLAMGANPGLLGGSAVNRMTHELAQVAATPSGMVSTMAGLVGLPAALIGYGKMKGREESSLF